MVSAPCCTFYVRLLSPISPAEFKSVMLFEPKEMEETSEPHTADFAISVLLNPKNRNLKIYPTGNGYLRLEDRVEHIYDILEKIIDHQVNVAETSWHRTAEKP